MFKKRTIYLKKEEFDLDSIFRYDKNSEGVQKLIDFLIKNKDEVINLDCWADDDNCVHDIVLKVNEIREETDEEYDERIKKEFDSIKASAEYYNNKLQELQK